MFYVFIPTAVLLAVAWIYGASKTSSSNIPIDQLPITLPPPTPPQPSISVIPDPFTPLVEDPNLLAKLNPNTPIVAGDFIVVSVPPNQFFSAPGDVIMHVDSLDVFGDINKLFLRASFPDAARKSTIGSIAIPRSTVRKATPSDIKLALETGGSTPLLPSPAAVEAAQRQTNGVSTDQPLTIADVLAQTEAARLQAAGVLVPQSTSPEALATLLALTQSEQEGRPV